MTTVQDPFISVREDVKANLEQANLLVESYQRICKTSATDSAEVVQTLEDIETVFEDIETDLADLQESIAAISRAPEKYNLTTTELEKRRGFVNNVKTELTDLKARARPANPFVSPEDDTVESLNDDEAAEEQYQAQVMAEQDTQLDSVFQTVGNLRSQAHTMGQELHHQSEILQEFEHAVDASSTRLKNGLKEIGTFLRKNEDCGGTCCIVVLIIVLIVLLIMVVLI